MPNFICSIFCVDYCCLAQRMLLIFMFVVARELSVILWANTKALKLFPYDKFIQMIHHYTAFFPFVSRLF